MRKITREAVAAFLGGRNFNKDNTEVQNGCMLLHGSVIARKDHSFVIVTTNGWNTLTTRERLNGIPNVSVRQQKGQLYLNGIPWDGSPTKVCVDG